MRSVTTPIRLVNILTGQSHYETSPLPLWLVLDRLRQIDKVHVRTRGEEPLKSFGQWDCCVYMEGKTVVMRLCPAGLEDTLRHFYGLIGGVA